MSTMTTSFVECAPVECTSSNTSSLIGPPPLHGGVTRLSVTYHALGAIAVALTWAVTYPGLELIRAPILSLLWKVEAIKADVDIEIERRRAAPW